MLCHDQLYRSWLPLHLAGLFIRCPPSSQVPFPFEYSRAGEGRSSTEDVGIQSRFPKLTPLPHPGHPGIRRASMLGTDLPRAYVPILSRPWTVHNFHVLTTCHLCVTCTLCMLERFYCALAGRYGIVFEFVVTALPTVPSPQKLSRYRLVAYFYDNPADGPGNLVSVYGFRPIPIKAKGNARITSLRAIWADERTCSL